MARQRYSGGMTSKGRELWAILLLFMSIFIFISLNVPNSTGFVGFWFVDYFARNLFGMGVDFTPLFFAIASLSLFFSEKTQYKWVLIGSLAPLVVSSVYLEFYINGVPQDLSFPIAVDGGGLIGVSLGYILYNSLGRYGTALVLASVIVMSSVMLFNVSLKKALVILRSFLALCVTLCLSNKDANKKKKQLKTFTGLIQELFRMLFYRDTREQRYRDKDLNSAMKTLKKPAKPAKPETIVAPEPKVFPKITQIEEASDSFEDEDDIDDLDTEPVVVSTPSVSSHSQLFESYQLPPFKLLNKPKKGARTSKAMLKEAQDKALVLEETLASFNVEAKVVNITPGPSVTRYELQPGQGVKVSKITNLAQDLALNLAAQDVRIEAPIPGKALVGIEVPNTTVDVICLKSLIDKSEFLASSMGLPCAMGMTITGDAIMMPLEKMPHVLIAGSTGSGKSVCINTIILSILMRSKPDEVKFLMIDPKKVELSLYEDIPHLLAPVVTNPQKAAATLKQWALVEMEKRYEDFAKVGVKDIAGYNNYIQDQLNSQQGEPEEDGVIEVNQYEKLPYIVVIIDELADLMMVAAQEVENTICRLAQMARATGIHLVVATQRPSVNVVTGLIKANIPSRISFAVQSQIDSRTILDTVGAEKLLGRGDMLYLPTGMLKPLRVQGVFVQEDEVKRVVSYVKKQGKPMYNQTVMDIEALEESDGTEGSTPDDVDELFDKAREIVQSTQYASTSYLQRKLRIGYNRAARIMDDLEEQGVIGGYDGEKKTRTVLS